MESVAIEYFPNSIDSDGNEKYAFHSYISDNNKQDSCYSYAHMFCLLKTPWNQTFVYCTSTV